MIDSSFDILIEYKGTNKLSSSSSSVDSLIKSSGTIEIKGNGESSLELQPNATTTVDCAIVRANKVIINGGNLIIKGSNGKNYSEDDRTGSIGRKGSSGIVAYETLVKNNAVVTITAGNGGNGSQGRDGDAGQEGIPKGKTWFDPDPTNGEDGKPGKAGGNGGKGGTAIDGNLTVEFSSITISGGNGGDGGDGGNGGDGGAGGWNSMINSDPADGGDGGKGGKGGDAGYGGDAVSGFLTEKNSFVYITAGKHGKVGKVGEGGKAGDGGKAIGANTKPNGKIGNPGAPGDLGDPGEDGIEHR